MPRLAEEVEPLQAHKQDTRLGCVVSCRVATIVAVAVDDAAFKSAIVV